jgi:SAM-dependent methyltransferase
MSTPDEVFTNCDVLEQLPLLNRENYEFETDYLVRTLPQSATVLQVGSMDGTRASRILEQRPDLQYTGLDISDALVSLARVTAPNATFVLGDITDPPEIGPFDYVICLNHTLGYIEEVDVAIAKIKELGTHVVVSVYGEAFDEDTAVDYFETLGLEIGGVGATEFDMANGWVIHRFTESNVKQWDGTVVKTPLGYLVEIA